MKKKIFIPIIVIILSWFGKIIAKDTRRKMFMRKISWAWGMSQLWVYILLTNIIATLDMSNDAKSISALIGFCALPLVYFIYRRIMDLYKKGLSESVFWKSKWWNYGCSLVAIMTITCFLSFVFISLPTIP